MRGINDNVVRAGLDVLYYSGLYHLMAPSTGRGVIFMLHRVRRASDPDAFAPNRALEVTPEFLDSVLGGLDRRGIDIVDLDEAVRRLNTEDAERFAVFTFDDCYADTIETALPIFEAHDAPFTIYVSSGMVDRTADIWWLQLEEALARLTRVQLRIGEADFDLPATNAAEKQAAWDSVYQPLRDIDIASRRTAIAQLCKLAEIEASDCFSSFAPNWGQLRKAGYHRLLTIGSHTVHHFPLNELEANIVVQEIEQDRARLQEKTGRMPMHFAFPFGHPASAGPREFELVRELGLTTAVTTRAGALFSEHAGHLHALPRVALNGGYQAMRYVDLFLSGAPFALANRGRKLNVA